MKNREGGHTSTNPCSFALLIFFFFNSESRVAALLSFVSGCRLGFHGSGSGDKAGSARVMQMDNMSFVSRQERAWSNRIGSVGCVMELGEMNE